MSQTSWEVEPNCANIANSEIVFTFSTSVASIDLNTVWVSGGAVLLNTSDIGSSILFTLSIDLTTSGIVSIGFDDVDGVPLTYSTSYSPVIPINFSTLNPVVDIDCGQSQGSISFPQLVGLDYSIGWFPNLGTFNSLNVSINDLPAGNYVVVIFDPACGLSQVFNPIIIPDGELSYSVNELTPLVTCSNSNNLAVGGTNADVEIVVSNGSGLYDFMFDNAGGSIVPIPGFESSYFGIPNPGTYNFTVTDQLTGCQINNGDYTITETAINLELQITEAQPLVTNGVNILQTGTLEAELIVTGATIANEVYTWSPIGFTNNQMGEYSDIDTPNSYTVLVSADICAIGATYNLEYTECILAGDVNFDGIVNSSDLLEVLGAMGTVCTSSGSCPADLNQDGIVNVQDILIILSTLGLTWDAMCD